MAARKPTSTPVRAIPDGTKVTEFIGEGSANVVVRIQVPDTASPETKQHFQGKLLRLQKASKNPESHPYPYATQYDYFREQIVPLFPETGDLVSHELVQLGGNSLIDQTQALLNLMDQMSGGQNNRNQHPPTPEMLQETVGHIHREFLPHEWRDRVGQSKIKMRKNQFIASKLAYVEYGLLVEDMSINEEEDGVLIEIKPKWLLQSASAPEGSVRCRNCAIELRRSLGGKAKQTRHKPCPMLLVSDDWRFRREYMSEVLITVEPDEWYAEPIKAWAGGVAGAPPNRLLMHIRNLQQRLDRRGPFCADNASLPLAMTMRDCSVFIRVVRAPPGAPEPYCITAKVGDLDMKNASAKLNYWKRTESSLIAEGAYTDEDYGYKHKMGIAPPTSACALTRALHGASQT